MSYGDYLGLDAILSAQRPLSRSHNEMLFIVQHQTSELWLKLALHEFAAAREGIKRDDISAALKMLARVSRILEHLTGAWTILSTLTPSEYGEFRSALGRSSGFQSHQYRMLEFMLGNKNAVMMRPHQHHPERLRAVSELLHAPSLYDEVARLLARRGFALDSPCLERDWTEPYRHNMSLEAAWRAIYADTARHWDFYELGEKLVDIEDGFRQWRHRHATTVERIIGDKRGTGGTSGVAYLKQALDIQLFPELWRVRTAL
jgi:tryptophan 2,3-dioxygenase